MSDHYDSLAGLAGRLQNVMAESRREGFGLGAMHRNGDSSAPIENAIDKTGGDLKRDWSYEGDGLTSNYLNNRYGEPDPDAGEYQGSYR